MSVVDKQASAMLDLGRSCGLVATDTITKMLSEMITGQVRALTTILTKFRRNLCGIYRKKCELSPPQLFNVLSSLVKFIFFGVTGCFSVSLLRDFEMAC